MSPTYPMPLDELLEHARKNYYSDPKADSLFEKSYLFGALQAHYNFLYDEYMALKKVKSNLLTNK